MKTTMKILFRISLIMCGLMTTLSQAQTFQDLSEMDISLAQQTYSAPTINQSITGEDLSIAGEKFKSGVGVHSSSAIKIKLNNARSFSAKIGISDSKINYDSPYVKSIPLTDGQRILYHVTETKKQFIGVEGKNGQVEDGSVIFRIVNNGKEIFNSGLMKKGDPAREVKLELKGGVLDLLVEDGGDGFSGDHAVWAESKFEFFEIAPVVVIGEYQGEVPVQSSETIQRISKLIEQLPAIKLPLDQPDYDWLIENDKAIAGVYKTESGKDLVLTNGLIARVFRLNPNLATIDYVNQMTGESLLRAVSNEGVLTIDGKNYQIGGLSKQPEYGYTLMKWVDQLTAVENSFMISDFEIKEIDDRLEWKKVRWALNKKMPTGKELIFSLERDGIIVKVHYILYDGIPTLSKWIEVINESALMVQLNKFKLEQLALVEGESLVDTPDHWTLPNIHFQSDYAFGAMQQKTSDKTTFWEKDPRYTSQTNYPLNLPCLLEIRPPIGPDTAIPVGEKLSTFRVWEIPMDSRDEERVGLFKRKFYRTVSPWTTENPMFLHLTSTDPKLIKRAVDQCAETGMK